MALERRFWKVTRWARALRFWLFLALAAVAWLGLGQARAQSVPSYANCHDPAYSNAWCANADLASSAAQTFAQTIADQLTQDHVSFGWTFVACHSVVTGLTHPQYGPYSQVIYRVKRECTSEAVNSTIERMWLVNQSCPPGQEWFEDRGACDVPCSQRDPITNRAARGSFTFCSDGCSYEQHSEGGITVCLGAGPQMWCGAKEWRPTGQSCSATDKSENFNPDNSSCRGIPGSGFNECVKPDGEHCVTGAKGTRMCWKPGESGERMPDTGVEGANKGPANSDPGAPNGMEDPVKAGSTTTTVNNNTTTTNLYNGSGNSGGQHNTGSGGSKPGGDGDGDGDGEDDGSVSGGQACSAAPICSGDVIMCAINEQTWRARCEGSDGTGDAVADLNDAIAGDEGEADLTDLEAHNDPSRWRQIEDLTDVSLDSSGFTSGECPALPPFSVGPASFSISLEPMCNLFVSLSSLVMALAYFISFKIIAGVK